MAVIAGTGAQLAGRDRLVNALLVILVDWVLVSVRRQSQVRHGWNIRRNFALAQCSAGQESNKSDPRGPSYGPLVRALFSRSRGRPFHLAFVGWSRQAHEQTDGLESSHCHSPVPACLTVSDTHGRHLFDWLAISAFSERGTGALRRASSDLKPGSSSQSVTHSLTHYSESSVHISIHPSIIHNYTPPLSYGLCTASTNTQPAHLPCLDYHLLPARQTSLRFVQAISFDSIGF
ncbi:uncharacterized protein F5Z01DRAFT_485589 [Emericellopsis atlantica]|uniref:Uncharacterized protein n=1 Tax=Emericellopsis atlantica TaxID=2614577 RepID=A0A9P7ZRW4_9HYPO|nr:uncharacterized protein F5Z01DRAFT_485589 [Emericellopsis atlantica]KAG9256717.1 hypothetical protein F5Z01DRAFT_485589 [Emericellopsis atlantica]